jgi:PAS domain S-box-containing protein
MKKDEMEKALYEAEEKYRLIFEHATEGIFQADINGGGRFTSANPALARLHGYNTPQELIDSIDSIRDQLFVDPEQHKELIHRVLKDDAVSNFEAPMKCHDGSEHWVSINLRAFRDENGRILYYEGTMRDITGRKEAQRAIAESEERYRTVIENSNDGIAVARGGKLEYVNPRFVAMFGYNDYKDIVGKKIALHVHPDDRPKVLDIHDRRRRGEPVPQRYDYRGITKSGEIVYVEVSAQTVSFKNEPALILFLRDVTERKRTEHLFLQSHRELEQLNRAKTKAVNHISHELKTPLAVLQGYLRVLRTRLKECPDNPRLDGILVSMERNLKRLLLMQKYTDDIMRTSGELEAPGLIGELDRLKEKVEDFYEVPPEVASSWEAVRKWMNNSISLGPEAVLDVVELHPILAQALDRVHHSAAHRSVEVTVEARDGVYVLTEPSVIRIVMDGLVKNAIENTPDGGFVKIWVEEKEELVLVHVTDCGVGIAEADLPYIFDGLFPTKEIEKYTSKKPYDFDAGGRGLDLLRMKAYAGRFGFELSVKSTRCIHLPTDADVCPGDISRCAFCKDDTDCIGSGGTTFTVSLPRVDKPSE